MWYVDEASLEDYRKLGVNAKVGGKLCPARNMVLDDAKKKKLVAVEVSDDIGKWVYYDCEKVDNSGQKDFKVLNNALLGTKKHIVSPLAAAQYILAKMRADPETPKLGGVFPTGNAAMTLGSQEYGRHHFILGDFFVAEPSSNCRFDQNMTLKEDYDYTCSHIKAHGSVMRCNRLFIQVKHATNAGGAVASRDSAGEKERANIAILQQKWPGVFRLNKNRQQLGSGSEVVMNWNNYGKTRSETGKLEPKVKAGSAAKEELKDDGKLYYKMNAKGTALERVVKYSLQNRLKVTKVVKHSLKVKAVQSKYPSDAVLTYTGKINSSEQLNSRCKRCHKKKVSVCLGMKYKDSKGVEQEYKTADLKYDINGGRLTLSKKA